MSLSVSGTLLRLEAWLVAPPLNGSLIGTPSKVSENCPLLKARKVMLLRTPLGPGEDTLIEGSRINRFCTVMVGEAYSMVIGLMREALKAEFIGMRCLRKALAFTSILCSVSVTCGAGADWANAVALPEASSAMASAP